MVLGELGDHGDHAITIQERKKGQGYVIIQHHYMEEQIVLVLIRRNLTV